jgi:hypothetical protein
MKPQLISHLRSGLVALGVFAGLSAPALAGPAGLAQPPGIASGSSAAIIDVAQRCRGDEPCFNRDRGEFRRGDRDNRQNFGRSSASNNNRQAYNRHYRSNDDWRWGNNNTYNYRHYNNRYNGRYYNRYRNSGISLYFDLTPSYRYVEPRRYYRSYSSAHVQWCYDRWRSYRAWDNTYQPYYGPRRQCVSPYI